jgi:hypothetical protein
MKWKFALLSMAFLLVFAVSSSTNINTSEIQGNVSNSLCQFKILVSGILPTMAIILFALSGVIILVGVVIMKLWILRYNKKQPEANLRLRNFAKLPTNMKIVALLFLCWALPLFIGGITGIILAIFAPMLADLFFKGTAAASNPAC